PSPGCRRCRNRGTACWPSSGQGRASGRSVNREPVGQRPNLRLDGSLDQRRLPLRGLRDGIEDLADQAPDLLELGNAEAARRRRRRAEADAGGDEWLLRIVGDAVLVAG